jgi:hypothetical protein
MGLGYLNNGIGRACKNAVSGYDIIYLFPWVKYSRSQIIIDGHKLVTFPSTLIYAFSVYNASFTEPQTTEDGGKFYTQNVSYDLPRIELNPSFTKLVNDDYRAIVKDRNGFYRIVGLYNGLISELNQTTGDSKNSFNGYKIQMEGMEILSALFIDDLEDAGFIISEDNFLLLEDGTPILTEGNEEIILE